MFAKGGIYCWSQQKNSTSYSPKYFQKLFNSSAYWKIVGNSQIVMRGVFKIRK